ncbi:MAG: hypothetical protein LBS25_05700, partial [Candidatus Symbiothrix sp.]|nr:hypothetical protein [Candidatus Symbiothrix sp.]
MTNKRLIIGCLWACTFFALQAQITENELTGTIIFRDDANVQTHTPADAFDGDLNTYFNSVYGCRNWIGMDLGQKHVITKIA